ncbi:MAG TPA: hypothetical protein DHT34_03395 [Cellvibrionales bacterium]|nr:hypothetical protein [Cellvibrionales bacterium]
MRSNTLLIVLLMASLGLNAYLLLSQSIGLPVMTGALGLSSNSLKARPRGDSATIKSGNGQRRQLESLFRVGDKKNDKALLVADLNDAFLAGDFDTAIDGWQWLSSNDVSLARQLKTQWLSRAEQWLLEDKIESVKLLTEAWLQARPYDKALRYLQVQWQLAAGQVENALETLYALMKELPATEQGRFVREISEIVDAEVARLSEQKAWQPMITFLERLLWHEPQHPPYLLMLAKAHIELQQYAQAKTLLYSLQFNAFYAEQVKSLLAIIALSDLQSMSIALEQQREHYLVSGLVDNRVNIRLMIDTGASISVMSADYFNRIKNQLGPEFIRNATINTAGGVVKAPIYQFASFEIGDYRIPNMEFVVMTLENSGSKNNGDGLLGMNYLKAFNFQINQENSRLLLKPR